MNGTGIQNKTKQNTQLVPENQDDRRKTENWYEEL